ncbi:alkylation response protein AidB-like acyl-CoA dehydrogenase [Melghirimyces profundicolus]|uniref:Alkylation response protein AidB-like acyl-CoA dehydrogenase n=1 Tax=Melghirimyces profundicolus TaxID=1242148 RepID=A0A2T6C914_9BACL|nr:acyl-CoA dehydrogenase family protein [Melghirimyces profundicolus]PTX64794.1 alkylation response protein AidB-like acyl-CoA dehydrogenase [Melghirimyces profundicolus]
MISFQPTEEERAFVDLAKDFAEERIRPMARECEEKRQVSPELVEKINELGFLALELPESWGGLEMPLISQVQILEALSFGDLGVVQGLPGAGEAASLIRLIPEHSVLNVYREAGREGSRPTVAFLHAVDNGTPQGLKVEAEGGGYVLNGTSQPVRLAAFADYLAVSAEDSRGEPLLLWLDKADGRWHAEEGDYRLGLLASGCARIRFDNERVSQNQVLAKGDEAQGMLSKALSRIRVLEAAKEVGLMEAALSYTTGYTAQRKAFGQEIAKFQGVSFALADMAIETQAARHLVWRSATKTDRGESDARDSSFSLLSRVHRSLRFVTDSAVQLLGGHGYVQEFPVEKWMRDAQAQTVLYGREGDLLVRCGEQLLNERIPTEV